MEERGSWGAKEGIGSGLIAWLPRLRGVSLGGSLVTLLALLGLAFNGLVTDASQWVESQVLLSFLCSYRVQEANAGPTPCDPFLCQLHCCQCASTL